MKGITTTKEKDVLKEIIGMCSSRQALMCKIKYRFIGHLD